MWACACSVCKCDLDIRVNIKADVLCVWINVFEASVLNFRAQSSINCDPTEICLQGETFLKQHSLVTFFSEHLR